MKRFALIYSLVFTGFSVSMQSRAQDFDLQELQGNIEIFSGVLEDALDLNQSSGLFGMSLGGVDTTYLYGQGVLVELRTPLANQRNRLSLASLNSALGQISAGALDVPAGGNPFERMVRRASPPDVLPAETANSENASSFYESMMERIAKIDYSLIVSNSIQQASDSARSLRVLGNVDESAYEELRTELDAMRARSQEYIEQLGQLEEEIRAAENSEQAGDSVLENSVSSRLDELVARLEPLREQAMAKAAELKEQTELAEQRYVERWHEDVREFEQNMYAALCSYGSTLRVLPDDESISLILKGLGDDEANDSRRPNKVHVLNKSDVLQCQSGEIDITELRNRSAQYSY